MTLLTSLVAISLTSLLLLLVPRSYSSNINVSRIPSPKSEADLLEFPQNLAYLVADFYLLGATGHTLDAFAPGLAQGGPAPIGGKLANLDPLIRDVSFQFGLIAIGHLRALKSVVKGLPRPLMNISKDVFGEFVNEAFGQPFHPPFDPYANSINFLLASYAISFSASTMYAGIASKVQNVASKELVAGLLGVASGLDTTIRAYLYEHRNLTVTPYNVTVSEFTNRISELGNKLGKEGTKSEGLEVPPSQGAEGKVSGNVIDANKYSLSYARTPEEILRIVYGSGDERVPGGFYPKGANVRIAKYYLNTAK
ncbi:hypothetical protein VNO77_05586 [Canavalia gladiata]|uniref:Desiccation-related protein PCC13-62 n=1 Tax=Canavalia gladiata TaxID=3824 RepID=A0AAN9N578_CANGL